MIEWRRLADEMVELTTGRLDFVASGVWLQTHRDQIASAIHVADKSGAALPTSYNYGCRLCFRSFRTAHGLVMHTSHAARGHGGCVTRVR